MKKIILYPLIFASEVLLLVLIAKVFNLKTSNSLYGRIGVCVMFSTLSVFLLKIIKDYKGNYPDLIKLLYFPIALLISFMVLVWFLPME